MMLDKGNKYLIAAMDFAISKAYARPYPESLQWRSDRSFETHHRRTLAGCKIDRRDEILVSLLRLHKGTNPIDSPRVESVLYALLGDWLSPGFASHNRESIEGVSRHEFNACVSS